MSEIEILDQQIAHLQEVLRHTGAAIAMAEQRRSVLLRAAQVERAVAAVYNEPVYHVEPQSLKQLGEGDGNG